MILTTARSVAGNPTRHSSRAPGRIRLALASARERETIYKIRHAVYATELGQHREHPTGMLTDDLDAANQYIIATVHGATAGFISITPSSVSRFSIDKYLSRHELPFPLDQSVFEVRLLTVAQPYRGQPIAAGLMYAALRQIESQGGARIIAIGRQEILNLYLKLGFQPIGRVVRSGAVTFEVMSATIESLNARLAHRANALNKLARHLHWQLDVPFEAPTACYHGGAFWEAIGDGFETLQARNGVVNADVLDAWFPPAPEVIATLQTHLPWLLQTSPPTHGEGLMRAIAAARHVDAQHLVVGAGSSDLIFLALRHWLHASSKVLILDPTYGEYMHVLERLIGCKVDLFRLTRAEGYRVNLERLAEQARRGYDVIILVNPNSPTGQHIPRVSLEPFLQATPESTRVWIDETYIDYVGADESLERFAAQSRHVIVCKSMSKVYALSGARAAYLCAPAHLAAELRALSPPWAVSLPAQVAATEALRATDYYAQRYRETHELRDQLIRDLEAQLPIDVVPGVANFLLAHLPSGGPDAASLCQMCRAEGVYLRNASAMSRSLGKHAVRIAVKTAHENRRIVQAMARAYWRLRKLETAGR